MAMHTLAAIAWDPQRNLFTIPWIDHPIGWYGVLFACGFLMGYLLMIQLLTQKLTQAYAAAAYAAAGAVGKPTLRDNAIAMTDTLCWFAVLGTVIGARLGHVFFYGWDYYSAHPWSIFKIWEGGLASHGGTIGVLIAFALYMPMARRYLPNLSYLGLLDMLCIPTCLVAVCIRVGNFINQEIVGTATTMPWGVIFGHPIDGPKGRPLHPVQLYEALIYLATFIFLYRLWIVKGPSLPTGRLTGYLFVFIYGGRIIAEWFKAPQGLMLFDGWLQIGQLLSVPFVLLGVALLFYSASRDSLR
jgi:phosphatidylglycerol:prolipoprotein diacylglycerol transferase